MSPKKKKPTMKELEVVINNIIHDLKIINQKSDAGVFGLRNFVEYLVKTEEYGKWLKQKSEEYEQIRKENERNKPIETSNKTDNESDSKGESVGSVPKS